MILLCGDGLTAIEVSQRLSKRLGSIQKWRKRYLEVGLSGLEDQPRSGRPRRLSPAKVRKILKATVQTIPRESTHWSLRLMAEYAQVSKHQVTEIWKAADLKPHRIRSFKISNDPDFAEKVIDVVGLYMDPPDNALVLSVDEKTQIQALDRTQPMLQLKPGQVQRRTHDYKRHGTASLFGNIPLDTTEIMVYYDFMKSGTPFLSISFAVFSSSLFMRFPKINSMTSESGRDSMSFGNFLLFLGG